MKEGDTVWAKRDIQGSGFFSTTVARRGDKGQVLEVKESAWFADKYTVMFGSEIVHDLTDDDIGN